MLSMNPWESAKKQGNSERPKTKKAKTLGYLFHPRKRFQEQSIFRANWRIYKESSSFLTYNTYFLVNLETLCHQSLQGKTISRSGTVGKISQFYRAIRARRMIFYCIGNIIHENLIIMLSILQRSLLVGYFLASLILGHLMRVVTFGFLSFCMFEAVVQRRLLLSFSLIYWRFLDHWFFQALQKDNK